ncbi:MAG: ROK family transcriptional regulator [Candidatus Omnitrophica bacterium]|nr:ROK family transcriptional regulator [Candidatus Omnitrophota bacterium]
MVDSMAEILTDRERKNFAILDLIRRKAPITRTEISKETELNIVTVSNYINAYIQKGLVIEGGLDVSTGGRRPVVLELNPKAAYIIGVGLDLMNIIGVVADLKANVLVEVKKPRPEGSENFLIDSISQLIEELIKKSNLSKDQIKGVGIGIPGIVDRKGGTIRWPQQMGSIYISTLKNMLEQKFDIPVYIENDATVAAFGEREFELESDVKNLVFMYSGVGCGIVINGQIYGGATGCAGELGLPDLDDKSKERWKGLERWEADLGLKQAAQRRLKEKKDSKILEIAGGDISKVDFKSVVEAARAGDNLAIELIKEAGEELGVRIAYLVQIFNPEVVVIGGGIERAGSALLDAIKKAVREKTFEEIGTHVRIVPTQLGENAVALGSVSLVIQYIFTYLMV